ncbi:hypothetical protein MKX03_014420 [Papaver bracteatum]|nr:hypothetical protein MKX03_014420 [Papaver bracteatum]
MNLLGGVPRKHKYSMPVVKKSWASSWHAKSTVMVCGSFGYLLSRKIACPAEPGEKSERKAIETWFRVYDKELGSGKVSNKDVRSKKVCDNPCDKDFRFGKLEYALIS